MTTKRALQPVRLRISVMVWPCLILAIVFGLAELAGATTPFVNETADGSSGIVGNFSSLALDSRGAPHVSYQDATTNGLQYARKSGDAWIIEIADNPVEVVGAYTSLALDGQGNPHVSYEDFSAGNLKYARKSGGIWVIETADGSVNNVGRYTSIALDAQGNPHVSYKDLTVNDLKYARKSGGAWVIETADGSANNVGTYTSIALDAQANPHVGYSDQTASVVKYARKSAGAWVNETVSVGLSGVGSLAIDAQGNPHLALHGSADQLAYARKSSGAWIVETVGSPGTLPSRYSSIALDSDGNPHVAFYDYTATGLGYARKQGGAWIIQVADGAADIDAGYFPSLALDAHGNPHVSYWDITNSDLKYSNAAVRTGGPASGVTWAVGSRQTVTWSGIGPVSVLLSVDGGNTYDTVVEGVTDNAVSIRVPHAPTRFARIRILREVPFSTSDTDSFFRIDATISLMKFEVNAVEAAAAGAVRGAVALSWETAPAPPTIDGYRVERSVADAGGFAPMHAGLLKAATYTDVAPVDGARYRLIAVNGLGDEYVLGEAAPALVMGAGWDLSVAPNPAMDGETAVRFRVPYDSYGGASPVRVDLVIYDASGRLVRTLASGTYATGVRSVSWDGNDADGRPVAPGTYFARMTTRSGLAASERIVVVR